MGALCLQPSAPPWRVTVGAPRVRESSAVADPMTVSPGPGTRPLPDPPTGAPWWPDWISAVLVVAGLLVLFVPTTVNLIAKVWVRDEQGHGPIILALVFWLLFQKRHDLAAAPTKPDLGWGIASFVLAVAMYVLGRSQAVLMLETGAAILLFIALLLIFKGTQGLRICWFPIFFMLFMVPLPATLVVLVTTPLKSAVSAVASALMYALGYPIGRSGVVLTVGPYQLLVADACAGLNSMFTLEALGLLYMNLMKYTSPLRNVTLAILIVPISFLANVIRVIILVLVTYHFGDEAGQGFVHGFAGMVLFLVALTMILTVDHAMRWVAARTGGRL